MNPKVKNKNACKMQNAVLHEADEGLPLFSDKNSLYFNEADWDAEEKMERSAMVSETPEMIAQESLQISSGGEMEMGMSPENGITSFHGKTFLPEFTETDRTKRDEELSGAGAWGEELLVLLPELQELTDRGNFVTGRASGDIPELPEILGKLAETSEKLERISSVIEKFEQEYRT